MACDYVSRVEDDRSSACQVASKRERTLQRLSATLRQADLVEELIGGAGS